MFCRPEHSKCTLASQATHWTTTWSEPSSLTILSLQIGHESAGGGVDEGAGAGCGGGGGRGDPDDWGSMGLSTTSVERGRFAGGSSSLSAGGGADLGAGGAAGRGGGRGRGGPDAWGSTGAACLKDSRSRSLLLERVQRRRGRGRVVSEQPTSRKPRRRPTRWASRPRTTHAPQDPPPTTT